MMVAAWALSRASLSTPAVVAACLAGLAIGPTFVARRLHDMRLSAWWGAAWFPWTMAFAFLHDYGGPSVAAAAATVWQVSTLAALVFLAVWPGTRGPNRYGLGRPTLPKEQA